MTKEQFYDLFDGLYQLFYKHRNRIVFRLNDFYATIKRNCATISEFLTLDKIYVLGDYCVTVTDYKGNNYILEYDNVREL